ncbi:EAL domain-containing protein [Roseicella frigidaeris]|uniref:EAL domain-containing protein n=1 Tax=Roseicella frigidaeris TaxID=2230885 RepID=UPI0014023849|nr:EAL domain-containing protein [Roseicella frigidaeris]
MHSSGVSPGSTRGEQVLVLARDPIQIAAATAATARLGWLTRFVRSGDEALARLAGPGPAPGHLVCDPVAAGAAWPGLLATLADPATRTALILLAPAPGAAHWAPPVPGEADALARALAAPGPAPGPAAGGPPQDGHSAGALRESLARGEISVHYQPVVRLSDRRPVMVEALARWHRPEAAVPPDAFVPLAERHGMGRSLSLSVARTAALEIGHLWPRLRLGVSINLPLAQLLQGDLQTWLRQALGRHGLGPRQLALELTETTPVHDLARLHRVLLGLRQAGYRVLLDDVTPGDGREALLHLPFAGLKLDRSLVQRLPVEAHGRQEVRRLVRLARAQGQTVVAEGISDRRIWMAVCDLGVDFGQGYAVGRPLPAPALFGWWARWRRSRLA